MAFFKFRWPGKPEQQPDSGRPSRRSRTPQPPSIEEMRRRARHRLIGAAVLVLAAIIGFPLIFDTQPRPIPVNVAIDIPDRHKVAPLVVPQDAGEAQPARPPSLAPSQPDAGLDAGEEFLPSLPRLPAPPAVAPAVRASAAAAPQPAKVPESRPPESKPPVPAKPEPKPEQPAPPKPEPKPETKPAEPKVEPKVAPKPPRPDEAARARALLEGRQPAPAESSPAAPRQEAAEAGRFIVQVGAFADADKAREVQGRLERSGLKAYTQTVQTKEGARTRVRVGPFGSRSEADKAADRIKGTGLAGAVMAL